MVLSMRLKMRSVAIFLIVLATSKAHADWQYTKWGMTPDQVVAASGGKAVMILPDDKLAKSDLQSKSKVRADYATNELSFRSYFEFGPSGLEAVRLKPINDDAIYRANSLIESVYGKPIFDTTLWNPTRTCLTTQRKWRDEPGGNDVLVFIYSCIKTHISNRSFIGSIVYTPIRSKQSTGL